MENQIDLWRNFDCSNVNTQKENLDSFIPARSNALCKPPPRHEKSRRKKPQKPCIFEKVDFRSEKSNICFRTFEWFRGFQRVKDR